MPLPKRFECQHGSVPFNRLNKNKCGKINGNFAIPRINPFLFAPRCIVILLICIRNDSTQVFLLRNRKDLKPWRKYQWLLTLDGLFQSSPRILCTRSTLSLWTERRFWIAFRHRYPFDSVIIGIGSCFQVYFCQRRRTPQPRGDAWFDQHACACCHEYLQGFQWWQVSDGLAS